MPKYVTDHERDTWKNNCSCMDIGQLSNVLKQNEYTKTFDLFLEWEDL